MYVIMLLEQFVGKRVYCKTFSGRIYEGEVTEIEFVGNDKNKKPMYLVFIMTKFEQLVGFNSIDLKFMEEEKR